MSQRRNSSQLKWYQSMIPKSQLAAGWPEMFRKATKMSQKSLKMETIFPRIIHSWKLYNVSNMSLYLDQFWTIFLSNGEISANLVTLFDWNVTKIFCLWLSHYLQDLLRATPWGSMLWTLGKSEASF
jgi:hypothetical protein